MDFTQRTISEFEAWTGLMYGIIGCTQKKAYFRQSVIEQTFKSNVKFFGVDYNQLYQFVKSQFRNGQLKFIAQYVNVIPEDEKEIIYCKIANMAFMAGHPDQHEKLYMALVAKGLKLTPDFVQNVNRVFEITHRGNTV
jgi:hypothetical protein